MCRYEKLGKLQRNSHVIPAIGIVPYLLKKYGGGNMSRNGHHPFASGLDDTLYRGSYFLYQFGTSGLLSAAFGAYTSINSL